MLAFIELHYIKSGDPFILNVSAISRVYTNHESGETRIALLEDKNGDHENPTLCSRQAVYRVRESYQDVKYLLAKSVRNGGVLSMDEVRRGIA